MPSKPRRQFTTEQKVAILRRHLVDKIAVSALCEEYKLQPSVFYLWQKQVFDNLAGALVSTTPASSRPTDKDRKIEALEAKLVKKDNVIAEISEEFVALKKSWGAMKARWVPHDTRDAIVDFVVKWSARTEISATRFIEWIGVQRGKFYSWTARYGKANEHNALVPRDHWIEPWERDAILAFHAKNTLEGYRRLTFMMLDAGVVAVSPTTTWRILSKAGVIDKWKKRISKKGSGFVQPLKPHDHWHVDIAHVNVSGTFYYLCSVLDGCTVRSFGGCGGSLHSCGSAQIRVPSRRIRHLNRPPIRRRSRPLQVDSRAGAETPVAATPRVSMQPVWPLAAAPMGVATLAQPKRARKPKAADVDPAKDQALVNAFADAFKQAASQMGGAA